MKLRVLSAEDVRRALPMPAAIEGMKAAYATLSAGRAVIPLRVHIDVPAVDGVSLFMPAFIPNETGETPGSMVIKSASVFRKNPERGLPTVSALVQLLDAETGHPLAILEGATLTAIRTGAGSGAATDLLARPDARSVAVLGSGVQARTQLEAVCTVRPIEQVRVYSPNREHAQSFANEMSNRGPIPADIAVVDAPRDAVHDADVICAATTSSRPVFDGNDLKPGAQINAVGSFQPHLQEIDAMTVSRSLLVVDSREAVLEEAGDLIIPIREGVFDENHIHAELGEIVAGRKVGRTSETQLTLFKSCGVAVQDVIAAEIAYTTAERLNLGTVVDL